MAVKLKFETSCDILKFAGGVLFEAAFISILVRGAYLITLVGSWGFLDLAFFLADCLGVAFFGVDILLSLLDFPRAFAEYRKARHPVGP